MNGELSNAAAYALLVGLAVPFATGLLVKASWPAWAKFTVALAFSAAVGFGTIALSGEVDLTWSNALVIIAAVAGAAQASFRYIVDRVPGLKNWLYRLLVHD